MRTLACLVCPALLAATLVATPPARAQGARAPTGDAAAATALFKEGREAAQRGDDATAVLKLAESFRLDPAAGTALNLADCEERLGRLASAWQHYELTAEKLAPGDERGPLVKQRLAALRPRLPRLEVRLAPGAPGESKVIRDTLELGAGSLGTPLPVDPGDHLVEVTAPGRSTQRFPVTLGIGESRRIEVAPGGPAQATEAPPPGAPSGPSPLATIGYVSLAAGAVGIGAAVVTGVLAMHQKSVVEANCKPDFTCTQFGVDAAQTGKGLVTANAVSWALGAAAAGAGVVLVVVGRRASTAAEARIVVLPGGVSMGVGGRF